MRAPSVVSTEVAISREVQSEYDNIKAVADAIDNVNAVAGSDIISLTEQEIADLITVADAGVVINGLNFTAQTLAAGADATVSHDGEGNVTLGIPQGVDGTNGVDGESLTLVSIVNNVNGTITLKFSDGTEHTTADLRGNEGQQGEKGVGIETISLLSDLGPGYSRTYKVDLTDESEEFFAVLNGDAIERIEATDVQLGIPSYVNTYTVITEGDKEFEIQVANGSVGITKEEIKYLYESNNDTNAYTDTEKSKLSGIENGATADQTKEEIEAFAIDASSLTQDTNNRLVTDTEKSTWNGKQDPATTLAGYGITDADTSDEVDAKIAALVDTAPETLDTLNELAAALGDDPNFATTVSNEIGTKVSKSGDTMTGDLTVPNLITAGNVDGRDVSVDGTTLDGVKTKTDFITVTEAIDLDAQKAKAEAIEERLSATHEPTGFDNRNPSTRGHIELCTDGTIIHGIDKNGEYYTNTSGNFANGTAFEIVANEREVAIFPATGETEFSFFVQGTKHVKTAVDKIQVEATAGLKAIYYDDNAVLQYTNTPTPELFRDYALVSVVYGNPTTGEKVVHADERHGVNMSGDTHYYLHRNQGTQYNSGLGINGLSAGATNYTSIDSGQIQDEDLVKNISVQTDTPFWYIDGDAWRGVENGTSLGYITATRPNYVNDNGDGTYTLTELNNNDFMIMHFMATNDAEFPVVKVIGQNSYNSVQDAQAAIPTEANKLTLEGLPSPEFKFLYSIIIGDTGDLRLLSDGSTILDLRETPITGTGNISGVTTNHPDLLNRDANDSHPMSAITDLGTLAEFESALITGV